MATKQKTLLLEGDVLLSLIKTSRKFLPFVFVNVSTRQNANKEMFRNLNC